MNRRGFLAMLGMGSIGAGAVDIHAKAAVVAPSMQNERILPTPIIGEIREVFSHWEAAVIDSGHTHSIAPVGYHSHISTTCAPMSAVVRTKIVVWDGSRWIDYRDALCGTLVTA